MPVLGVLLGETQFAEHLLHFPAEQTTSSSSSLLTMTMMWKSQLLCKRTPLPPRPRISFPNNDERGTPLLPLLPIDVIIFYASYSSSGGKDVCVFIPRLHVMANELHYRLGLRSPPNEIIKFVNTFWVEN